MPRSAPLPRWQQISELLARDIGAGRLPRGARLPPERRLAREFGVAVGTLRRALLDLETQGLLRRVQGSGNYVSETAGSGGLYAMFRLERTGGGAAGLPSAELLDMRLGTKPADLPPFGSGPRAHRIRRLRRLDGVPVAVEEIWFDPGRPVAFDEQDVSDSLYLFYRARFGVWVARAEDRVVMGTWPSWTPPELRVVPFAPCPRVDRLAWATGGLSVEASRTWFDPERAAYVARMDGMRGPTGVTPHDRVPAGPAAGRDAKHAGNALMRRGSDKD